MRFLNIKTKITLWYTTFMVALVVTILGVLVEFTDITLLTNQKNQLVEVIEDTIEDIKDGDDFDYFDDNVFIITYDKEENYLNGSIPFNFSIDYPLKNGQLQEVGEDKKKFYIYDRRVNPPYGDWFWVRGVFSDMQINNVTQTIVKAAFILLPILVIISTGIGYFITKKALLPVKKIQETAENISKSNQLSLRIGLPSGSDEIARLGTTIDNMLEKLEKSFLKEKQFTSDASHELRTPVTVILAESEYMLEHGENIEEARESMEVINRQAKKISALINQLLFFSRADRGEMEIKLEKVDIIQTLKDLKSDNTIEANKRNITIEYENNLENKEYSVDKIMFIRAIQNILQNAINYGKENGFIKISSFEEPDYLAISIEDNGIGIEQENLEKIWNRFYQVEESRTGSSMGLGLSMVKLIIEKHHGYVDIKSELGVGTTFTLYFKKV
ncbi:Sensor protein qseC [Fusobacterium necrogenes]|uniref:histidine kinase n=1 Tax=Fusobacterium necrogenes TaxID=858 RepID=A0A377GWJ8_9FUSO|nr:HAMP domain-containing sensor histidine kinase [Fusobacterium necrogenes]STO31306.1 Sensor protein qseC [Fusobacterium necrogenes]